MTNCVFADEHNILDKLAHLFSHPEELQAITDAGYKMVHARHASRNRDQMLQWLKLHEKLRPGERIVQRDPFAPLIVERQASKKVTPTFISEGLHLRLLAEGDRYLEADKYLKRSPRCIVSVLTDMQRLPEAKLRLAICDLYIGNAQSAFRRLFDLIQYTIGERKAQEPDPVEWAYYIVSLLCLGRFEEANEAAGQFTNLSHLELERARSAVSTVRDTGETYTLKGSEK